MKIEYIGRIEEDLSVVREQRIVICGCGKRGRRVLDYIRDSGTGKKDVVFCDVDKRKQGSCVDNIDVMSYEDAIKLYRNACFVVANMHVGVVVDQLERAGIKNVHIVR